MVIVGTSISLLIEMTQFITASVAHDGHIADINDWLCNSIGTLTGTPSTCWPCDSAR